MPTRPDARPLRADAARNRRLVVEAARVAFARGGVSTPLDEIARAAGVGQGTLYRHFPTRNDLVLAVISDGLSRLRRLGADLLDDPDPFDALTRWLAAFIEQGALYEGLAQTLAQPSATVETAECQMALDSGTELVRHAVRAGAVRPDADADDVRQLAVAIAWIGRQPPADPDRPARLLQIVLDGLRPAPTGG